MNKTVMMGGTSFYRSMESCSTAIKKRKGLFIFMLIFQLLFLIILSSIFIHYQIILFDDLVAIGAPLESLNLDEESLQSGEKIVDDPYALFASYKSLMRNITYLFTWLGVLFLIVNPWLWIGSSYLMSNGFASGVKLKQKIIIFSKMWLKYVASALMLFIPFGLLVYFLLLRLIGVYNLFFTTIARVFVGIFFVLFFIFLMSNSRIEIGSWKKYVKCVYELTILKFVWSLLAFLLVIGLTTLIALALYYTTLVMENFPLMIICAILLIVMFVVGKIFMISIGKELTK